MKRSPLIVIGSGEHAGVVIDAARANGDRFNLLGFLDHPSRRVESARLGLPYLGTDDDAARWAGQSSFILGIGQLRGGGRRRSIVDRLTKSTRGWWATVIHPAAVISPRAWIERGAVVLAGAVVQTDAAVGAHSIVNTRAVVEHDAVLGQFSLLGPAAVLGGAVVVGDEAFIGMGAIVRDHLEVGTGATIGMGSVVTRSVPARVTVAGNPARPMALRMKEAS